LILIASYLSIVKNEIFDPLNSLEWLIFNNMNYKNTFQYTSFLQRKNMLIEKQQLQSQYCQTLQNTSQSMNFAPIAPQTIQLLHPFKSTQNKFIFNPLSPQEKLQNLKQQLEIQSSIIQNFIYHLTKNKDYFKYLMNWLAVFFQTLNKTDMALVLLGDKEATDTFVSNILRPIFTSKKEYFSVTNDETLKKTSELAIEDKIFYHIDEISTTNIKDKRINQFVRKILKTNTMDKIQAVENDEIYIHGELIITSSNESPYPFLEDTYSRCSVFKVSNLKTIMKALGVSDYYDFEEKIKADLGNFSNILAQYQTEQKYNIIYNTAEKIALPEMKKGILLTPMLESQIQRFIDAIKEKDKIYFKPLELEDDKNLYKELVENFDNYDAIYQPLLSEYFNIIHEDIIFPDNSYFIDILKEMECLFNQTPDDKFKANGQRRYKLYEYKLAKNYKGSCEDTI
ncbi:MAG: hypothetical protein U9Q83_05895, partial [Bacteroidota bacterium]|nr:hypothetical protein [Bacteroidota bacterium]